MRNGRLEMVRTIRWILAHWSNDVLRIIDEKSLDCIHMDLNDLKTKLPKLDKQIGETNESRIKWPTPLSSPVFPAQSNEKKEKTQGMIPRQINLAPFRRIQSTS